MLGMEIGIGTLLPQINVIWPHQVRIGRCCTVEPNVYFKYDGPWRIGPSIRIGDNVFLGTGIEFNIKASLAIADNCLIASGSRFIDHDHGLASDCSIRTQPCKAAPIELEEDIWIG